MCDSSVLELCFFIYRNMIEIENYNELSIKTARQISISGSSSNIDDISPAGEFAHAAIYGQVDIRTKCVNIITYVVLFGQTRQGIAWSLTWIMCLICVYKNTFFGHNCLWKGIYPPEHVQTYIQCPRTGNACHCWSNDIFSCFCQHDQPYASQVAIANGTCIHIHHI